jgi:hypothetical protein
MKNVITRVVFVVFLFAVAGGAAAQQATATQAQPKTLAATIDVYVFPSKGQDASQQSQDESGCYTWAVQNTGSDPFALAKQADQQAAQTQQGKQQASQAGTGSGARGAVGGAAAGALIGEIASNDPGRGAAYGAAAGLIAGRRRGRQASAQATQQVEQQGQQAQAATATQIENFKKAFSVCLEAKDYLVKF